MSEDQTRGVVITRRILRNPVLQIAGIVLFGYFAAEDARAGSWSWSVVCVALVILGLVNLAALQTRWRPPWLRKHH